MSSTQLEVTEATSDSVMVDWDSALPTTSTTTTVVGLQRHDLVHHLPSSVEYTLASLPYDDLDFPPCTGASAINASTSLEL